jgi:hypothetical protein
VNTSPLGAHVARRRARNYTATREGLNDVIGLCGARADARRDFDDNHGR